MQFCKPMNDKANNWRDHVHSLPISFDKFGLKIDFKSIIKSKTSPIIDSEFLDRFRTLVWTRWRKWFEPFTFKKMANLFIYFMSKMIFWLYAIFVLQLPKKPRAVGPQTPGLMRASPHFSGLFRKTHFDPCTFSELAQTNPFTYWPIDEQLNRIWSRLWTSLSEITNLIAMLQTGSAGLVPYFTDFWPTSQGTESSHFSLISDFFPTPWTILEFIVNLKGNFYRVRSMSIGVKWPKKYWNTPLAALESRNCLWETPLQETIRS